MPWATAAPNAGWTTDRIEPRPLFPKWSRFSERPLFSKRPPPPKWVPPRAAPAVGGAGPTRPGAHTVTSTRPRERAMFCSRSSVDSRTPTGRTSPAVAGSRPSSPFSSVSARSIARWEANRQGVL